jgi:hypothetical protein
MEFIGIYVVIGITLLLAAFIAVQLRQVNQIQNFLKNLEIQNPYYLSPYWADIEYQWGMAGETIPKWQRGIVFIGHKRLSIYPYPPKADSQPIVSIDPQELRGFWRPDAYHDGRNDVWIHAESLEHWGILKLRTWRGIMADIIRALKEVHSPEQVKAYRRRRPYLHKDPALVLPAKQSLTGEWELFKPVEIYLMPLHLVIMKAGIIQRVLHIEAIQDIAALKRMEGGEPTGVIRFSHDGETFAFATNEYETWAKSIAEAAKRSLEEPVMQKQKSKDDEWEDVDIIEESAYSESEPLKQEGKEKG